MAVEPHLLSETVAPATPPRATAPAAGARIVRSILALGTGQIVTWASATVLAVLLPRYLGDVNLGKLSLAFSFTDVFGLLAGFGIGTYLTKLVARGAPGAGSQVLNALLTRLPLALVAAGLAALSATLAGYDELTRQLIYLYCIHMVLAATSGVLVGALQGMQEMRAVAVAAAASKLALLSLVVLMLVLGHGVVGVAIAGATSTAVGLAGYLYAALRRGALVGRIDSRLWRSLFLAGVPFLIWEAALLVYGRIDVILLSFFTNDAVIGWYGAAYRIITIPGFIPAIIMTAVFPALSAFGQDRARFTAIARRAMQATLVALVPIALGIVALPDRLVATLGYPAEFNQTIPLIVILALHIPLLGADMIIGSSLISLDKQRQWAFTGVVAAVLNPAMNAALIPLTQEAYANGAIGAAVATVLTELFMMCMGLWLLRGAVFDRGSALIGLKCLLAGVPMVAAVWPARELPLPFTVVLGGSVYATAALGLGILSLHDLRIVRSYVLNRARAQTTAPA